MAEKVTLTCDRMRGKRICGDEPAHTYVISGPQGEWEMDLCDQHCDQLYGVFTREGRVSARNNPARRTLADATRPWIEERE